MNKTTKTLNKIPQLLNSDITPEQAFELVLEEYKELFDYDLGFVLYFNGESLEVKTSKIFYQDDFKLEKDIEIGFQTRSFVKHKEPILKSYDKSSNSMLTEMGIKLNESYAYMALPLMIKSALFGLIFIVKKGENSFNNEDLACANSFAGACSYVVKDAELSNVFKLQLGALKENMVEKTNAYEYIKEQNEKIKEADRLKSEFLANMSHELRTPLNAIIGFSEALKLKVFGELNAKQEEYIDDIHSSGIHLLGMINDLLDISKIEANAMKLCKEKFNALNSVNEVCNVVRAIANKKNISISINCEDENIEIKADEQKFHQIMYNLLSNAIKFTEKDGNVNVDIYQDKDYLRVSVQDNGIGIEEKYHGKIFAKFQQVDSSYTRKQSSTGLGLTITKELVEMHGGKIWLQSKVNEGTTFTFEIPLR